ncbi:dipeptidyl aminopeptidase/acylaminoacyl peptidase [Caulobacter ginsengisoli]|uniref:Dipeptidyl aminopeptidase/acylaminoacyl peptidase n=1 Tax=Caulobacter ginsengisoli TaxID=400775 RepID=A0ABU0IVW1_9CAUL|nr:alpha/beta fold hydrolase [Caulobacter ginsengisoli]MDQ0465283.1 dipeptidyl aminopeptidase/acylaminoacyl peptidase [Caulobacter ginsengisoli]
MATALAAPLASQALAGEAWAADAPGAAAVIPPTLDELLKKPVMLDAALSPDGERVAMLREVREGDKRLAYLRMAKVGDYDNTTQVLLGDFEVEQVEWASNDRLLIWLRFDKGQDGKPTGIPYDGDFIPIPVRRVMAVSPDGKNPVALFGNQKRVLRRDFNLAQVVDVTPDDPDHVIMQIWNYDYDCWALYQVNIHTGEAVVSERGSPTTDGWFLQNGRPVLRYDSNDSGTSVTVSARAPGESDWKVYRKFRRDELKKLENFDVMAATPEPGVLLVASLATMDDAVTVRRFDLRNLTMGEVVAHQPGRDISGVFCDERSGLVASRYLEDRQAYLFTDPKLAAHFKGMNAFFGNECNVRLYDVDQTHNRFITFVSGPRQAGGFHLYDRTARQYAPLGDTRPWLDGRLASMEILKVKARDGLDLTAYLTVPVTPAAGPRPMVVMPHGGPQARDGYDYDLWAQALAAQGWLVLQPNFRGSGGYGKAFAAAGHRRWGDAMQWDVEDCVEAVVKSGRADPGRLAILGASYGGYAALMGVVLKPDLYRCAVSRAGDSDLNQLLTYARRDEGADSLTYKWWVRLVGDPKTDAAMLKAGSPRQRVGEIKAPLLLYHGSDDHIVTPEASRDMAKAMKKAGKPCEYVEVKGEGHNGWAEAEERRFLERAIGFIARNFQA